MFLENITPSQEHFLKKYLLKNRLSHELLNFSSPNCFQTFGPPFVSSVAQGAQDVPLFHFFFSNYIETFPFIAHNSKKEQKSIWQDTVQPFVENLNLKGISGSDSRENSTTKRRQVNSKFMLGLLLFYNSMIISPQESKYLAESKLNSSSGMDKIVSGPAALEVPTVPSGGSTGNLGFVNGYALNIVAVRKMEPQKVPVSSWKLLLGLFTDPVIPKHNYEFIIEVKAQNEKLPKKHYINRLYHEFHKLEHLLRKVHPGLMSTQAPKLPHKQKNDTGIDEKTLFREKLRLSLRGYIRALNKFPEIALLDSFEKFLNDPTKIFEELPASDKRDSKDRLDHEAQILQTQLEFQKHTSKLIISLSKDFDDFKKKLVMDPSVLTKIFHEIGHSQSINDLSPLLRIFFEWSKLEIAATFYQVFLSQDNSGEWLLKCKKFHRLFPYSIVYGILKFTNPMKIVSKVIDLLLVNIPSVSFWSVSDKESSHTRNLLSMIFMMVLDEDLNDFEKELKILEEEKLSPTSKYVIFLERIRSYVEFDADLQEEIKDESEISGSSLVYTILSTNLIEPHITSKADIETLRDLKQSEDQYRRFVAKRTSESDTASVSSSSDSLSSFLSANSNIIDNEDTLDNSTFYHLQQYWQIQTRKKDKDLMKQLWQEPELTKLIKKLLNVFYQPLMKVFSKSDIHIIFRDFQAFLDDLVKTLERLSDGEVFLKSSFEIFEILKGVLDRHEVVFWRFLHNLYNKDDDHLFIGLIKWIERFLIVLRYKISQPETVCIDFNRMIDNTAATIDTDLLMKQLDALTNQTLQKRKLYKEFLEKQAFADDSSAIPGTQEEIDKKWEDINNKIWGDDTVDFGMNNDDIVDFNVDEVVGKQNEENTKSTSGQDRVLQTKLKKLNEEQHKLGTSELDKFDSAFKAEIVRLFQNLTIEAS